MPALNVPKPRATAIAVAVAALGYFVDIYDLILFGIIRLPSLKGLGLSGQALTTEGEFLGSVQMAGLLIGGIFWGVLGDRRGRLSVLFGSILTYSLANIANGFVQDVSTYAVLRFVAGLGLAGELGAGITLVSELMRKESRGYGTTLVATFGILGAVAAFFVGDTDWGQGADNWRVAYFVGGGLGLLLLLLRIGVSESGLFNQLQTQAGVQRGNFLALFRSRERFRRFLQGILVGVPIWYAVWFFAFFPGELVAAMGLPSSLVQTVAENTGVVIMYTYIGLSLGDLSSGLLSQLLASRKKAVLVFLSFTLLTLVAYLNLGSWSGARLQTVYLLCFLMGFGTGYWAVFVTNAAEQFGTNLRATVATTTPNFVRGSVALLAIAHTALRPEIGLVNSLVVLGLLVFGGAYWATWTMRETFGTDLDFVEKP